MQATAEDPVPYHDGISTTSRCGVSVPLCGRLHVGDRLRLVEAMVVYYLRKLFAHRVRSALRAGDFHFPRAYLHYEQAREAATMVMLLAVGFSPVAPGGSASPSGCSPSASGTSSTTLALGDAALAVVAGIATCCSSSPPMVGPVWMPVLASCGFIAVAALIVAKTRSA